jgi:hypothetical protein
LLGSWALLDARAIDAAIDRVGGAHKLNCAIPCPLDGLICFFVCHYQKKRGLTPSEVPLRSAGSCKQQNMAEQRLFSVQEAPATAKTQVQPSLCMHLLSFILILIF